MRSGICQARIQCAQNIGMRKMIKGGEGRPQNVWISVQNEMQTSLFEKQERVTIKGIKM